MPTRRRLASRVSALPALLERAPARVLLIVGLGVVVLGALIVTRPLTSLVLLGIYVGVSAIVTGVFEFTSRHRAPTWWTRALALAWIVGGVLVLAWLGRSLDFLPAILAVLLVLGGLASFGDMIARGRVSQRVLAAASGVAQIAFGVLSTIAAVLAVAALADRFSGIFFEPRDVRDRLGLPVFATFS